MAAVNPPVLFADNQPVIIAALHLPPSPAMGRLSTLSMREITDFALRNTEKAVQAGIPALYIQDLGDQPIAKSIQPQTVAFLTAIGAKLREEFPNLVLGVCAMSHGAREPLAIAQTIGAQFVRLKVFIGAMVKAEGILEGCAYEAISYRAAIRAEEISILADVHDRTGTPLDALPLVEAARSAAVHNRADALILTGLSFDESMRMIEEVYTAKLGVPLLLGGGADEGNIGQVLRLARGAIVSSAFKPVSGWTKESMLAEWDLERMRAFMRQVNQPAR